LTGPAASALAPASVLVALLLLAAGVVLYAAPARRYRTLGQVGLALGAALSAGRHLGLEAGLGVAALGLLLAWLLDGVDAPAEDPLGLPMRLLLAAFAAVAAAALVAARPLDGPGALDANVLCYWTGGLGLLLLLSERGPLAPARGGALLTAALGLAGAHLVPGPPLPLLGAAAALVLGLGAAGRWLRAGAPLPAGRAAVAADAGLAALLVAGLIVLAGGPPPLLDGQPGLAAVRLTAGLAAALLALTTALHTRLAGVEGPTGPSWAGLAAGLVTVAALATPDPGAAGVVAAGLPLVALVAAPRGPRAPQPLLLVAAAGAAAALAFALAASVYGREPRAELARAALALVLVHAGLIAALPPWHLWALGLARRWPALGLVPAVALGGLAGLALLDRALEAHPWLLGVVGARPLALGIGLVGLVVGALSLLAEERPARLALQLGAIASGVALMTLATDPLAWGDRVGPAMVDRALALGLALIGADAAARWPADPGGSPPGQLLRPATLPLWVGLAGLAGLPPTGGFAARWLELSALWPERPELLGLALLGGGLGLLGLKRAGDALVGAYGQPRPAADGEPPSAWRLAAPLVLTGLYLLGRLYPAAILPPVSAMPPL
jgi:hypothetical protein